MKGIFSTILFWIFTNGGTEEKCRVTCFVYSKAKAGIWQFWASGLVTAKIPFIHMGNILL